MQDAPASLLHGIRTGGVNSWRCPRLVEQHRIRRTHVCRAYFATRYTAVLASRLGSVRTT